MKKIFKKYYEYIALVSILVVIFLLHTSYIFNDFTWLDYGDIVEGDAIIPLKHIGDIFFVRYGETGFYRPLVTLVHSIDYLKYGLFAPGYHVTNVILHTLVAGIAPLFVSLFITLTLPEMLIIMLIVGLHPLGWLPVGAISYRPELLFTLFTCLTVYLHVKTRRTGNQLFAFFTLFSFALALLSKETALILLPAILIYWEYTHKKNKNKTNYVTLFFSEAMLIATYLLLRFRAVPEFWGTSSNSLSLSENIGTRVTVIGELILSFISPFHVQLSDAVHIVNIFSISSILFLTLFIIVLIYLIKRGIKNENGSLLFLFILLLTPTLQIIPLPRIGSPHYAYILLPVFAGIFILCMRWFLKQKSVIKNIFITITITFSLIMSWTTFVDGYRFQNDLTLFKPEVSADNTFLEGHFYLGTWYLRQGEYQQSEIAYKKALLDTPEILAYQDKRATLINLSSIALMRNNLEKADEYLVEAEYLEDRRHETKLVHNRMMYFYKKKDYKSVFLLSQDGRAFPYAVSTYVILIDSLEHLNKNDEADKLYKIFLRGSSAEQKIQFNKVSNELKIHYKP